MAITVSVQRITEAKIGTHDHGTFATASILSEAGLVHLFLPNGQHAERVAAALRGDEPGEVTKGTPEQVEALRFANGALMQALEQITECALSDPMMADQIASRALALARGQSTEETPS